MLCSYLRRDASGYLSQQQKVTPISPTGLMVYVNPTSYPGSGLTWTDLSGNGNNMTISGATFSSNSFTFNGTSSYITTPNIYTLFTTSNSNFSQTQEVWFKSSNAGCIISEQNATSSPSWYDSQLEMISSTTVKGRVWNQLSPYSTISSAGPFTSWTYLAWRYNGATSTFDCFINGNPVSTASITRQFSPSPAAIYFILGIGGGTNLGSGSYFNGQISIYRNYKVTLTNDQILSNYNTDKAQFGY